MPAPCPTPPFKRRPGRRRAGARASRYKGPRQRESLIGSLIAQSAPFPSVQTIRVLQHNRSGAAPPDAGARMSASRQHAGVCYWRIMAEMRLSGFGTGRETSGYGASDADRFRSSLV